MKKIIITLTTAVFILFGVYYLFEMERGEEVTPERTVEQISDEDVESIRVSDEREEIIFETNIEEFRKWAEERWGDLFRETPRFAEDIEETEITPDSFHFFDKTAALSPDKKQLAFSVHSYFAATHMSFIGIVDTEDGQIDLVRDYKRGEVEEFFWSSDSKLIVYPLATARARGDYLSVDNIEELEEVFTLSEEDILSAFHLNRDEDPQLKLGEFLPRFRNIKWKNDSFHFTTDNPENSDEEIDWKIDRYGENLEELN